MLKGDDSSEREKEFFHYAESANESKLIFDVRKSDVFEVTISVERKLNPQEKTIRSIRNRSVTMTEGILRSVKFLKCSNNHIDVTIFE